MRLGVLREVKGRDGALIGIEEIGVAIEKLGSLGASVVGVAETGNEGRGVVRCRVGVVAIVRGVA